MASVVYAIVFSGQVVEGFQPISVKAHMAKMLKADADKMKVLFSGKPVVLKRTPDKELAIKYGSALKKVGADVKVKAIKQEAPATPPKTGADATPAGVPAAPTAADTGELTLAPANTGVLVEPKPAPPPPQIDLSGIQLAANDDSPLAPPREQPSLDIDLSEYSIGEMDGSPLVEPSGEQAPKVEAPDFGLDEPGAVLDTIKEEKELVNPDISGLSLAAEGGNLVDESEKPKAPPPRVPDTSNIHLVPNFDT